MIGLTRSLVRGLLLGGLGLGLLAACSSLGENSRIPGREEYNLGGGRDQVRGRLGGTDGIVLFGTDRSRPSASNGGDTGGGIGVNAFLWRATLDTLSFMPLTSADPFGGVIVTDWYTPPGATGERFKATAYILGRQLRSDGVRVVLFRQEQQRNSNWVDVPVSAGTAGELEDQVLARARELRAASTAAVR